MVVAIGTTSRMTCPDCRRDDGHDTGCVYRTDTMNGDSMNDLRAALQEIMSVVDGKRTRMQTVMIIEQARAALASTAETAEASEDLRTRLYQAAISCGHQIDASKVILHYESRQPGHNALAQLADRLAAVATPTAPAPQPQPAIPRPELTVMYHSMPESNGKSNWTATLKRKSDTGFDSWGNGYSFSRSEYPDRVRYEADCMRFLIGELETEPFILDYDAEKHSGYAAPPSPQQREPQS